MIHKDGRTTVVTVGRPGLAGLALLAGLADCVSSPELQAEAVSISALPSATAQLSLKVGSDMSEAVWASAEAAPMSAGPNPAMLQQCQLACKSGSEAVRDFCRSIPDPRIRGACWAYEFAVLPACLGFCFLYWGT